MTLIVILIILCLGILFYSCLRSIWKSPDRIEEITCPACRRAVPVEYLVFGAKTFMTQDGKISHGDCGCVYCVLER